MDSTPIALAAILFLGIGAQWIAWRIRLPAILLLLLVGLIAGPATGLLKPDEVFGESLLLTIVSLSVAVIMFEGGLNLKFSQIREVRGTVFSIVSIGMLVSWAISTFAAKLILDFTWPMSLLIGGILVVTGPTVIGPLLRQIRPKKRVASVLRWEGILIDPIGALLAVLVYEGAIIGAAGSADLVMQAIGTTVLVGFGGGLVLAAFLVLFFRQFWIPDFLHSPFTLMVVIGSFAASNLIQHESGLLTVTVMGVALANQKFVKVEHILEFKENLQVLLIASLFVMLSARIEPATLGKIGSQSLLFLAVLVFIGRPASVFISTIFSNLNLKEKLFLSFLAPRGIVAAAVSSVFALELMERGIADADLFVPNVFFIIVGTVLIYGLGAGIVARKLGLADADPQGVLFIGSNPFSIAFGQALKEKGFKVLLVDTNWENVRNARVASLEAIHGNVLNEKKSEELDLEGIGKLIATTPNHEVNTLSLISLGPQFGSERSYQMAQPATDKGVKKGHDSHGARIFVNSSMGFEKLNNSISSGASIKVTGISKEFDSEKFLAQYGERAIPLAIITDNKKLQPFSDDYQPKLKAGVSVVFMLLPETIAS